jgi:outer membrane receptor protein involved in Fe transport
VSLSAAYRRDQFLIDGNSLPESFRTLDTRRLPIEINYFAGNRLSAGARLTLIRQSGLFTEEGFGNSLNAVEDRDSFAVMDLSVSYRLPNEHGQISLNIDNALDERFRFQDIDPENPNMITERVVALRFTIAQ